jgi:SAM-dependent methyltransferase
MRQGRGPHRLVPQRRSRDAVRGFSFDVVCCAFGLMFFPESGAVREMRRVLKPGGRLLVMVWGSILKCPGQMAMQTSWQRHFNADYSGLFGMQHSLGEPSKVQSLVEDGGFGNAPYPIEVILASARK